MTVAWIIHNSQAGNTRRLSNQFAEALKDKFEVKVGAISSTKPEEIINDNPEALVLATRIQAFGTDRKMTKYVKSLEGVIKEPIPKVAVFYTHAAPWKNMFSKGMRKTLEKATCFGEVCQEFLEIRLEGMKGPERPDEAQKIKDFEKILSDFIGS